MSPPRRWQVDPNAPDEGILREAASLLERDGLVVFPTETVYGIGARADSPEAMRRLIRIRRSPPDRPFTQIIPDREVLFRRAPQLPPRAHRLARTFWPGPLTLVVPTDQGDVGFRIPDHVAARRLLDFCPFPVAAPSANVAGHPAPSRAEDVHPEILSQVDGILDAGPARLGEASTVAAVLPDGVIRIVRQGVLPASLLEESDYFQILFVCTGNSCRSPMAEALCARWLADRLEVSIEDLPRRGYRIVSAGTAAPAGMPPTAEAMEAVREWGLDLSDHRATPVTATLVEESDLVFALAGRHRNTLLEWLPECAGRIRLLDPSGKDVADPIGASLEVYRTTAHKIFGLLQARGGEIP